jgi:asparagine synthase (glutamine-hydrolysing)
MRVIDEPIGDPLNVPNVLLAEAAAEDSQTVFNGEGGDPVFGGPKNLPMLIRSAFGATGPSLTREELYLLSFNKGSDQFPRLLAPEFTATLSNRPATVELFADHLQVSGSDSLLRRLMLTNLRLKGAAQILPKVFKTAGAPGMEVQSPLFDQKVAEFAFLLPDEWKQRGAIEKFVLKEAVRDLLPASIIERPKSGMLVPCEHWLRKEMRRFAHDLLLTKDSVTSGIFNRAELKNLLNFRSPGVRVYHGDRIWLIISLELWLREHGLTM